jgi:perosamine synthetase
MDVSVISVKVSDESIKEVVDTLKSGFLVEGKKTAEFEKEFARYIGVKHTITVPNGTIALQLAIKSLNLKEGEIITTPFTFIASANSILYNGLKPVFADINSDTFNLDPERVLERITSKTKAILPVHLFGQPCEMKALKEICEDHDLYLIEDSAQAHGAEHDSKKTGSMGDLGCFSFYATKNIVTGEGGMITTNSDTFAKRIMLYKNHGQISKYSHTVLGFNYRVNDMISSIGLHELKDLDANNTKRIINAERMNSKLKKVKTPVEALNAKHIYHQYVIKSNERNALQQYLSGKNVSTAIHYPLPVHKQKVYRKLGYKDSMPVSEEASEQVLSLPVHQHLTREQVDYVIKCVNEFVK